jgi:hypothetical protein
LFYAAKKKPRRLSDEEWNSAKTKMQQSAQTVMNQVTMRATQN